MFCSIRPLRRPRIMVRANQTEASVVIKMSELRLEDKFQSFPIDHFAGIGVYAA